MNNPQDSGNIKKMSDINQQMIAPNSGTGGHQQQHRPNTEGLPMKSSPYVQYTDLEEYKRQGYGTEGHLEPKPIERGSGTDAPTISGNGPYEGQAYRTQEAARRNL